ncbi:heterokaryon incompatibility protein-domain-containing protein [Scleroderma citrinum]
MRLISVKAFLERERSMGDWLWLVNTPSEVLKEFFDGQAEYATLSHRWGTEPDYIEVVELTNLKRGDRDKIRRRDGYQKILNACRQAKKDDIEWLWVDTCCIDKRSSSELSEAINSMYRWYENSKICYAYLHDVEDQTIPTIRNSDKFPTSNGWPEWFSRGWTLPELIAPSNLQFFNKHWKPIGDKVTHAYDLTNITRVPAAILFYGLAVNRPCIAQIMSWAADRKTTRVEDHAYSLMGLLDVNMPILYGEGKKAFQRLQLEIIEKSNDQSIFAWDPDGRIQWTGAILAGDPSFFRDCHDIEKMETDERLGTFSVNKRIIQIWSFITPLDDCPTVFFQAALACRRRWDPRPVTIDVALWMSSYWRYPGTPRIPKAVPQLRKLCLSYQSEVYPDFKFDGLDEIQNTLTSRGFAYCGSFPYIVPRNSASLILSGVNELVVAAYEKEQSSKVRLAVVYGYSMGHEWVRVMQEHSEVETWQEYANKVYNQMWMASSDHSACSRNYPADHVHLIEPEWSGWAVKLTRMEWGRPTSYKGIVSLHQCKDDDCGAQHGWDDIKRTGDMIRMLTRFTKRIANLNGQVNRHMTKVGKHMDHVYYRGDLLPEGKCVRIQRSQDSYSDEIDAFHEPLIWSLLQHENVHPFLGIVTTFDNTISSVVQWIDNGNAHHYVQDPNVDPSFLVFLGLPAHYTTFISIHRARLSMGMCKELTC